VLSPHPIAKNEKDVIRTMYLIVLKIIRYSLNLAILANVVNILIQHFSFLNQYFDKLKLIIIAL